MIPLHRRLMSALATLRWSYATLAAETGVSPSTACRWGTERYPAPAAVLDWLERLAKVHRDDPAPRNGDHANPAS